jgi:hypothetical protein
MKLKFAALGMTLCAAAVTVFLMPDVPSPIAAQKAYAKTAAAPAAGAAKKAATPVNILQLTGSPRFVGDAGTARGIDIDGLGVSFEGGRVRAFDVEMDGTASALSTDSRPFRAMTAQELTDAWFNANFGFKAGTPLAAPASAKFAEARKLQVGNALYLPSRNLPDDGGPQLYINTKGGTLYYFTFGGFAHFNQMKMPAKQMKK